MSVIDVGAYVQPPALVQRSYQGAEPSRTSSKKPKNLPADRELAGPYGADQMRAWAREMVRNNAYAWNVVDTIVSNVIGDGIKALSTYETPDGEDVEDINDLRDKEWADWCEFADINGQLTFNEIQILAMREMVEAGEVLIRMATVKPTEGNVYRRVPLALEVIEADRLASDKDTQVIRATRGTTNRIVRGIELDDKGRPIAYWIYKDHPNSPYSFERVPERVDSLEILHLYRKDRASQTRGVSWFAPIMQDARDLGVYRENEMQTSAVTSCFGAFITLSGASGDLSNPDGSDNTDDAGNRETYLEPGIINYLNEGEKVDFANPSRPNSNAEPWINLMLRGLAAGTGTNYEAIAKDFSKTSYSSSRTSKMEDRPRYKRWQNYIVAHLCMPVWDEFCNVAARQENIKGFPDNSDLLEDRRKHAPVEWQLPEQPWVDPQAEQASSSDAIAKFMDTYQGVLGTRGLGYRPTFYQRAKEERLLKKLGLLTPDDKELQATPSTDGAATNLQSTALNGAQVTSLVDIITQVGTAAIPKASATAILAAAFPTLSPELIASIIDPIVPGSISADGVPQAAPEASTDPAAAIQVGTSELADKSTMQQNRNIKAIMKTLAQFAAKEITETQAKSFLSMYGVSAANIDTLIADASDGQVDTPETEVANVQ